MRFCTHHITTIGNQKGADCAINLFRGYCSECSFKSYEIRYENQKFYISHSGKPLEGECPDFKLPDSIEKKLANVPEDQKLQTLKDLLKNSK